MSISEPSFEIDDLTPRAEVFRCKLIDSFQLLDSLSGATDVPKYYSSELAESPQIMDKMMLEAPHGLIKFKVYQHSEEKKGDRRLNKVRMKSQFGLYCFGPWAKEITENKNFQHFMSVLIVLNSLILGVTGEVMHHYPDGIAMWCLDMVDHVSLVIFVFEIFLKLLDQPTGFWKNGWNIFDFLITMLTVIIAIIDIADPMSNTKGNLSYLAILKGFRILRSLKMLTRFAQLRLIVLTILKALSSIGVILLLLLIVLYLFAVMGLILFKDYNNQVSLQGIQPHVNGIAMNVTQRFGNFVNSTLMVIQLFTVDEWYTLLRQIEQDKLVLPVYAYLYIIIWLFVGAIMFKNIFVGIMVMNFKTIRDDFIEQCLEREEDLEIGQRGILLEVELAMHHASFAASGEVVKSQSRRTSLECGGHSGMIPYLSNAPPTLAPLMEEESGSDISQKDTVDPFPVPIPGVPFSQVIKPSLSEDDLVSNKSSVMTTRTASQRTLQYCRSDISQLLESLRHTKSLITSKEGEDIEYPESRSWNDTVRWNFQNFEGAKETLWPRDTLFRYLQLMEQLQDNLAERHQLQRLSVRAITNMLDAKYE